jgi:hypothetical protein
MSRKQALGRNKRRRKQTPGFSTFHAFDENEIGQRVLAKDKEGNLITKDVPNRAARRAGLTIEQLKGPRK